MPAGYPGGLRALAGSVFTVAGKGWHSLAVEAGGFCCVAHMIDPSVFTTERADIRVEVAGRWTKGMTVGNFEKMGGMHHFGGTAMEQTNFRHTVAMTLDHPKFCDLIVDALQRLTTAKYGAGAA